MANLKKLDSVSGSEEGKWVDILDGDGNRIGIRIKVKGIDSKTFKSQSTQIRKYVQKQKEKGAAEDQAIMDEKSYMMLAAVTVDWEDTYVDDKGVEKTKKTLTDDDTELKFNTENAIYLYSSYPMIANQVTTFMMERSNFLAN